MGSWRVRHDWATSLSLFTFLHWRRKWQPTPVLSPGESQGWGAWWAAVYGDAQSRTRLKRLSSSNHTAVEFLAGVSPHINKEVSGRIRKIESRLWTSSISQVSIRLLKKLVVGSNLHVFWKSMSLFLNLLTNFCYYQTLKLFQSLKWYLIILFSIFWFVSKF